MLEILPLVLGILLAQVSPGPNMMAVSSIALGSGRRAGVATAAGVATGVLLWSLLFALGIGAVLQAFPETITAMRLLGGGYLLFLGAKGLRAAFRRPDRGVDTAHMRTDSGQAFRTGLLVVMTNPKAALMWVAISMFLASSGPAGFRFLAVGICASASAMAIYGTYALMFSTGVAVQTYGRFFRVIEAMFGAVFGMIGAKLVTDGLRELRS